MHLLYCWMSARFGSEDAHFAASDLGLHCLIRHVICHEVEEISIISLLHYSATENLFVVKVKVD